MYICARGRGVGISSHLSEEDGSRTMICDVLFEVIWFVTVQKITSQSEDNLENCSFTAALNRNYLYSPLFLFWGCLASACIWAVGTTIVISMCTKIFSFRMKLWWLFWIEDSASHKALLIPTCFIVLHLESHTLSIKSQWT